MAKVINMFPDRARLQRKLAERLIKIIDEEVDDVLTGVDVLGVLQVVALNFTNSYLLSELSEKDDEEEEDSE